MKIKDLLESASAETLIHYMIKEIEHTWRIKFIECQQLVNKEGVEQMILIIDLKGTKLKDLSNKQVRTHFLNFIDKRDIQIFDD